MPHDTSVQKLPVTMKMWMQFHVMPWTSLGVDAVVSPRSWPGEPKALGPHAEGQGLLPPLETEQIYRMHLPPYLMVYVGYATQYMTH